MAKIYFDHNATVALRKEVRDFMYNFEFLPYNPSSTHFYGREAKKIINDSREILLQLLNAKNHYKVIFTSSATEANSLILYNYRNEEILSNPSEHLSIVNNMPEYQHFILSLDKSGKINLENYEEKLSSMKGGGLVTVMTANNETGLIQDIKLLSSIAHKYNCFFHTDATQAFGKILLNITELDIDFMTISSHKIGGPAGTAALIYKEGFKLEGFIKGGGQELGLRGGTENVIGISGFAEAAKLAQKELNLFQNHTSYLRNYLENEISKICKEVIFFSRDTDRLPNVSNFTMPNVPAETQIINFDLANIMVSSGSACSSGKVKTSHVLESMGYDELTSATAIRVSFGMTNNIEEVIFFLKKWYELYNRIIDKKKIA